MRQSSHDGRYRRVSSQYDTAADGTPTTHADKVPVISPVATPTRPSSPVTTASSATSPLGTAVLPARRV